MKVAPKDRVPFFITGKPSESLAIAMTALARAAELRLVENLPESDSPVAVAGPHRLMPHIEVDPVAEQARLKKEIANCENEIAKSKARLANASFVDKAPAKVVEEVKARLADFESKLEKLLQQLARVSKR